MVNIIQKKSGPGNMPPQFVWLAGGGSDRVIRPNYLLEPVATPTARK
ncbi:MAG: hypothetical protein HC796_07335 [Synechococcaceae cyanobacterium RL_1_2]|nr:hypothetical protein [Synechococcaceae cyanobacterium RL_1_2]